MFRYSTSLITLFFLFFLSRSEAQTNDSAKIQYYNNLAIDSFNQYRFEKAEAYLDSALSIQKNATTYYLQAYIAVYKNNWADGIEWANRSISLDSNYLPVYAVLFNAYFGAQKWDKALMIAEKAKKGDGEGIVPSRIAIATATMRYEKISNIVFWLAFFILSLSFLYSVFRSPGKKIKSQPTDTKATLSFIIFLTATVSLFFFFLFFSLSKWIWSLNPKMYASEITPLIRKFIYQHDGIESLVLYVLVFLNIILSILISRWILQLRLNKQKFAPLAIALVAATGYYFYQVGFYPPTAGSQPPFEIKYLPFIFVFVVISWLLYLLNNKNKLLARIFIFLLIAFVSLIPAFGPSANDLAYIMAPALRLENGFRFSEIYFQYDIFLSLLGVVWLKLNWALDSFPYLAQVSFFLFFTGCMFFSDRFLKTKGLSVLFILALILVRYYGVWEEQYNIFQVAPLRLDLWLILLIIAYVKGIRHWATGLSLGLLIIFHRNLGLIYMISYLLLVFFLFLSDIINALLQKKFSGKYFFDAVISHLRSNWINLSLIAASIVVCFLLTGEIFSSSAIIYRKYGIGMLPIARNSFYWYILILLSSLAVLLIYHKNKLTDRYFSIALFTLLLAIGNSMYFFGRSHENNIMNISGIFVLCLFILFDILLSSSAQPVVKTQKTKTKVAQRSPLSPRNIYLLLPFLFILVSAFYYAPRVNEKLSYQLTNLQNLQFTFPLLQSEIDTATIKELTHGDSKVLFLEFEKDFYYYYAGRYKSLGLYNPIGTSIFKKDVLDFLQTRLNDHYYIVVNSKKLDYPYEYLQDLDYNSSVEKNDLIVVSKETVPHLLSDDAPQLFHIAIKDSLSNNGVYHAGIPISKDFTVEALIKPVGKQPANAPIISNLTNVGGVYGLTLQANDSIPGQWLFVFGDGSSNVQNIIFTMENNQWHYLTIAVADSSLKIYDWGKQIADSKLTTAIKNNDEPLMVGNRKKRDAHFNGFTREIKITNGVNESGISEKAAQLLKQMNAGSY